MFPSITHYRRHYTPNAAPKAAPKTQTASAPAKTGLDIDALLG